MTSFRKRFNNRKSSRKRYERGQKGIRGRICTSIFFEGGHEGLMDVRIMIIDKTNVNEPTEREEVLVLLVEYFYSCGVEFE